MQWMRHFLPVLTPAHRALLRLSRGALGGRGLGYRFLLLDHVGRRSGEARSTPLLYVEHEGRYLVVASNAGQDHHPAWWLNLQSRPDASVQIDGRSLAVRARQAGPEEAPRLWPVVIAAFRQFESYRQGTDREIPLVVLEPDAARRRAAPSPSARASHAAE